MSIGVSYHGMTIINIGNFWLELKLYLPLVGSTGASLETGQCKCLHHLHLSRFYLKAEESENGLDLQYCNGQKRYDFSIDEGFFYSGCDSKHYRIVDLSPQAFRRAYIAALFAEDEGRLTAIGKYQILVKQ